MVYLRSTLDQTETTRRVYLYIYIYLCRYGIRPDVLQSWCFGVLCLYYTALRVSYMLSIPWVFIDLSHLYVFVC
jgi:hypothetical protein